MNEKQTLRNSVMEQRKLLNAEQKQLWDEQIFKELKGLVIKRKPKTVHTFISMEDEINTMPLIEFMLQEKIVVVCPKAIKKRKMQNLRLNSSDSIENGIYGTQHPANTIEYHGDYDMILVPGLAFDKQLNRLGYGAGYYDAFLCNHPEAIKIGVCYPFQIIDNIPVEAHDIAMDIIIFP